MASATGARTKRNRSTRQARAQAANKAVLRMTSHREVASVAEGILIVYLRFRETIKYTDL